MSTPVELPIRAAASHSQRPGAHVAGECGAAALALSALGIVFGDIGTSPLYTLRECLLGIGGMGASSADVLGVLSLMIWALTLVVTIKYLYFVLRADHNGEGGIFALLALVPEYLRTNRLHPGKVTAVALLGVVGAALLYGDGVITPAISVLSATEGLSLLNPALHRWIVPITCLILAGLFTIQRRGTGKVGQLFGPIMLVWFGTLGVLGLVHIHKAPQVLEAFSPLWAIRFFVHHGLHGFLILGSVVLVVTGGEALYADLGHFGRAPIRRAWLALVFPALLLGYLGQGAIVLSRTSTIDNPFFAQVPPGLPTALLVVLSSLATIIASQALISGAFSLTRQAMILGYFPAVTVHHTSENNEGQIYIPEVNVLLAIGCLGLVLTFRQSVKLAAAYGIAVTGTMAITSILFFIIARHRWNWPVWKASAVLAFFLSFDIPFLVANLFKFLKGGYVPVLIGALLIAAMLIWNRGRTSLEQRYATQFPSFASVRAQIDQCLSTRVPGTAVFVAPSRNHIPPILMHFVQRCRTLSQHVILLNVCTEVSPQVPEDRRSTITDLGDGFWQVSLRFGFMEHPRVVDALQHVLEAGRLPVDLSEVTYYVGRETLVSNRSGKLGRIAEHIFAYLQRNAVDVEATFCLPPQQVIEIGTQVNV